MSKQTHKAITHIAMSPPVTMSRDAYRAVTMSLTHREPTQ